MGRRSLVALGALALTLTAVGCGARDDPSATPARPAGASTEAAATESPSAGASSPATAPSSPGVSSATLIAFVMVLDNTGGATEVSGPDQIDRFVGGPPAAVDSARTAVARYQGAGTRLFAFVLAGCQNDGAALTIAAGRITATLTGGEGIACFAAEWYLAVFAVPASQVPPGARVG
jgi:hypothetical protein